MELLNHHVLALYQCGSHAFKTSGKESDVDYIMVVDDFEGISFHGGEGEDYFIFGKETFQKKMEFSDSIPYWMKVHNDEVLALPETLIFLDESYKNEFLKLTNIDWKQQFNLWLKLNIEYFESYEELEVPSKKENHIYRIMGMIKHLERTGVFSLDIDEPYYSKLKEFKFEKQKEARIYNEEFKYILNYLRNVLKKEEA